MRRWRTPSCPFSRGRRTKQAILLPRNFSVCRTVLTKFKDSFGTLSTLLLTQGNQVEPSLSCHTVLTKFNRGKFPGLFVERRTGPASRHPQGGSMLWVGEVTAFLKLHLEGDLAAAAFISFSILEINFRNGKRRKWC